MSRRNGDPLDLALLSALGGIRTPNLLIRSQMLYPLSYERWSGTAYLITPRRGPERQRIDLGPRGEGGI